MISIEWETPQDFFDELNKEFCFVYDVAASSQNSKCERFFSKEKDGLKQRWYRCGSSIWLNPPYDKSIGLWIKKAYKSSQVGCTIVCLIQGRSTDTKMWHDYVMKASEIRFIRGRLQFLLNGKQGENGCNISSVVVIFRPYCKGPPTTCSINTKGERIG